MANAGGEPEWLAWTRRLQFIAQNGLTFAQNEYDIERCRAVRAIAGEMLQPAGKPFRSTR